MNGQDSHTQDGESKQHSVDSICLDTDAPYYAARTFWQCTEYKVSADPQTGSIEASQHELSAGNSSSILEAYAA